MSRKVYEVGFNKEAINEYAKFLDTLGYSLNSREFKRFILDKCIKLRDEIMLESNIANIEDANDGANQEKVDLYTSSNKTSIQGDTITLYNDAYMSNDELTHFFDEDYRDANYNGLDIASLVEFGVGLKGLESSKGTGLEWDYQINSSRDYGDGWYYKGDNGVKEYTSGSEGKYIYYQLTMAIEKNIESWIEEYLDNKIGSV